MAIVWRTYTARLAPLYAPALASMARAAAIYRPQSAQGPVFLAPLLWSPGNRAFITAAIFDGTFGQGVPVP